MSGPWACPCPGQRRLVLTLRHTDPTLPASSGQKTRRKMQLVREHPDRQTGGKGK